MKPKINANQIIIETTTLFGIVNLYAAPDTTWTEAIGRSVDNSGMQLDLVRGVMAYKPHTLVFNTWLKGLFMVKGQGRHRSI